MPTLILPSGRVDGHLAQRGHETTGLATRGTDGSNPPPSTGEPTANLSFRVGIASMTVGCEEIRRAWHRHVTVGRTTSAPCADWSRKQRCPPLETAWPMWRFSTGNWRKALKRATTIPNRGAKRKIAAAPG
jgi:hypothetical protein